MDRFTSKGRKYSVDQFGVIHQEDAKPFRYDPSYVAKYDTPEYLEKSMALSTLRLGWVSGVFHVKFNRMPRSLVDVGYGNGAFLREAAKVMIRTAGKDVCSVDPPAGSAKVGDLSQFYDVVTFWDSLEHHADLEFVRALKCNMVAISVPWCLNKGGPWFDRWKHRKPDEHLHHFSDDSLKAFMRSMGWKGVAQGHHEDVIRTSETRLPNILSMAFVRADA